MFNPSSVVSCSVLKTFCSVGKVFRRRVMWFRDWFQITKSIKLYIIFSTLQESTWDNLNVLCETWWAPNSCRFIAVMKVLDPQSALLTNAEVYQFLQSNPPRKPEKQIGSYAATNLTGYTAVRKDVSAWVWLGCTFWLAFGCKILIHSKVRQIYGRNYATRTWPWKCTKMDAAAGQKTETVWTHQNGSPEHD